MNSSYYKVNEEISANKTPFDNFLTPTYKPPIENALPILDMLFDIVNDGAKKYIRPYAKDADIVISGTTTEEYIKEVVAKIKNAIRSCLY